MNKKIGIDLRPLQLHHQFRGIGMHIKELMNFLPGLLRKDETLILYMYQTKPDPIKAKNFKYEVCFLPEPSAPNWPAPFFVREAVYKWRMIKHPLPTGAISKSDVWLGFDFMLGLPKDGKAKLVFVLYDLIPLIYKKYYFPPFIKLWRRDGWNIASRDTITQYLYKWAVKQIARQSNYILPISDSAAKQLKQVTPDIKAKLRTVYLGSPVESPTKEKVSPAVNKAIKGNYLLYIGGGDARRKIDDLVSVFGELKDRFPNLQLVLAGNDFSSFESIPYQPIRKAIEISPRLDSINLLGFINDTEKQLLLKHAQCFVYPTLIEGFGLPLLEAMEAGCPVISYKEPLSSVEEVASDGAVVIDPQPSQLKESIEQTLSDEKFRKLIIDKGFKNAKKFSWEKNTRQTLEILRSV